MLRGLIDAADMLTPHTSISLLHPARSWLRKSIVLDISDNQRDVHCRPPPTRPTSARKIQLDSDTSTRLGMLPITEWQAGR
jgi:hypothetical protein